jgi:hypothetical protein
LADFTAITALASLPSTIDTSQLFDPAFTDSGTSPVDQFLLNANELNLLYLNANPLGRVLGALVFLGYISAVESYVRTLIRRIVNIDEVARRMVEAKPVSFGAAISHPPEVLPEALLEGFSLADPDNVKTTLQKLTGILVPATFSKPQSEFKKLCQVRHCCTHRFGKLGTNNAIELGLKQHKALLEKPLALSAGQLDSIAENLRTFVKGLNNEIYGALLRRTVIQTLSRKAPSAAGEERPAYTEDWTWDLRRDRRRFSQYYSLFATTVDAVPSPPAAEMYERFRVALR